MILTTIWVLYVLLRLYSGFNDFPLSLSHIFTLIGLDIIIFQNYMNKCRKHRVHAAEDEDAK